MATAYFAGGCFWCITPTFQEMVGVRRVTSGYSGGEESAPTYEDVKHQRTGHRETIAITYNEGKLTYRELLDVFLANVDPFDEGGQFIDRGHSYTLAVYYQTEEERDDAQTAVKTLEETSGKKVYVAVEPFKSFYAAEEYHQDYYLKNPEAFRKELIESGRIKL
jgi:peptide-methionine (S)-S-oxide reductase